MNETINRAVNAQRLLDDPLISEAFHEVERGILDAMRKSAVGDVDTHHTLAISLQLLGQVEQRFRNWVRDGELESSKKVSSLFGNRR